MANLPDVPDPKHLRASDADRERVAAVLRDAASEGRLSLPELDDRLAVVYEARTYADLEPLTADLPSAEISQRSAQRRFDEIAVGPTPKLAVAFMSGFQRTGAWTIGKELNAIAVMGGGKLDLREARFAEGDTTIRVFAFMGGVEIVVPPEADVHVNGFAFMGGFNEHSTGPGVGRGPRITITGFALMGGVEVKRAKRKPRKIED